MNTANFEDSGGYLALARQRGKSTAQVVHHVDSKRNYTVRTQEECEQTADGWRSAHAMLVVSGVVLLLIAAAAAAASGAAPRPPTAPITPAKLDYN